MHVRSAAALVVCAALLGGAATLALAWAAGWLHGRQTVVLREQPPLGDAGRPIVVAKPLVGNGFQPAQIFARRAAGVVTILSYFDDASTPDAAAGQGSGFVVSAAGTILTSAHVVTTAGQGGAPAVHARSTSSSRTATAYRGASSATTSSTTSRSSTSTRRAIRFARCRSGTPRGSSSVRRSPRSGARSGMPTRSPSGSSLRSGGRSRR